MDERARSLDAWMLEFAHNYRRETDLHRKREVTDKVNTFLDNVKLSDKEKRKYIGMYHNFIVN